MVYSDQSYDVVVLCPSCATWRHVHTAALYGKTGLTRTVGGGVVGVVESASGSVSIPSSLVYTTNGVREPCCRLCLVENLVEFL